MSDAPDNTENEKRPKVFISYAWTSEEYKGRVEDLASRLVNPGGLDVQFDAWDLKHGQNKYAYMESMAKDPDITHVLMLFNPTYKSKANDKDGGVGDESQIISPEIYEDVGQTKFVGAIFDRGEEGDDPIPVFYKGRIHFDLSDPDTHHKQFEALLRHIYGKPESVRPTKSPPPSFVTNTETPVLALGFRVGDHRRRLIEGNPAQRGILRDAFEEATRQMGDLEVLDAKEGENLDEVIVEALGASIPLRDDICQLLRDQLRYCDDADVSEFRRFLEGLEPWLDVETSSAPPPSESGAYDGIRFFIQELVLHLLATLIEEERLDLAEELFLKPFFFEGDGQTATPGIEVFTAHLHHLECLRKARIREGGENPPQSVVAQLLHHRLVDQNRGWKTIIQADLLFWLRSIDDKGDYLTWVRPSALYHLERYQPCRVFSKAKIDEALRQQLTVFLRRELEEVADLAEKGTKFLNSGTRDQFWQRYDWSWPHILALK